MSEPEFEWIKILVVSPIPSLRIGMRALLANNPLIKIIGETGALAGASAQFPGPDILILARTGLPENDLVEILDGEYPGLPVLWMIDPLNLAGYSSLARRHPIGLLPLDSSETQIMAAIAALAEGLNVISQDFKFIFLETSKDNIPTQSSLAGSPQELLIDPLTPREKEILQALGQGLANKEIALQFKLSDHTVKYHISSIFSKFGVSNRTEAVRAGVKSGQISL